MINMGYATSHTCFQQYRICDKCMQHRDLIQVRVSEIERTAGLQLGRPGPRLNAVPRFRDNLLDARTINQQPILLYVLTTFTIDSLASLS